jgi:DNA-binding response OmpR family regulator
MSHERPEDHPICALVVDDEATIRLLVSEVLQLSGFRVEEAPDAASALRTLARVVPDVILIDARLPDTSGFDLCTAIRQLPVGKSVPILMMTGMDSVGMRPWARKVGASDIIGKPLNLITLGQQVRALLTDAPAASSVGPRP